MGGGGGGVVQQETILTMTRLLSGDKAHSLFLLQICFLLVM